MLEEESVVMSTRSGVVEEGDVPARDAVAAVGELQSGVASAAGAGKAADPFAGAASDAA